MDEVVSVTAAKRSFARILREVRQSRSFLVTRRGRPVARIVLVREDDVPRERAHRALIERLRRQPAVDVGPWTRDELYDD